MVDTAGGEFSLGGRDAEMTFGLGKTVAQLLLGSGNWFNLDEQLNVKVTAKPEYDNNGCIC